MLYILDASVLITAHNSYYPVDKVPEFWGWLQYNGTKGKIKIPLELFEEITDGSKDDKKDLLFAWVQQNENKEALVLQETPDINLVQHAVNKGYATDLTDDEVEQLGRDPFILAYALKAPDARCIVTTEVSKPKKQRQNRHIPDVCKTLGVQCCNTFNLLQALGFSTAWQLE